MGRLRDRRTGASRPPAQGDQGTARQGTSDGRQDEEPLTKSTSIEALQTAIGSVQQTIEKVLGSSTPPGFEKAVEREDLQQLLYKISLDVGKLPVLTPPVSGDPYALNDDEV